MKYEFFKDTINDFERLIINKGDWSMSKTIGIREKATLIVEFDSWKRLNNLKNKLGLKTIDEVIQHLLNEYSLNSEKSRI